MRLKRRYKDILYDLIEDSEFKIKEFDIDSQEDFITINYISNEIKLYFTFRCIGNKEFLVAYNTPIDPDTLSHPIRISGIIAGFEKSIRNDLSLFLTKWLKEIKEEIKTPDKFKQYFNNLNKLKFNSIPESKGKQPPNIT